MSRLEREREAKLALLEALAASQRAVARMLESAADLNARFPARRPEDAAALLARLAALQLRMSESLLGVKLRRLHRGRPSAPWLAGGRLRPRNADGGPGGVAGEDSRTKTACRHARAPCGAARAGGVSRARGGEGVRASSAPPGKSRLEARLRTAGGTGRPADGRLTDGREPE
jgi:hypothetical protein